MTEDRPPSAEFMYDENNLNTKKRKEKKSYDLAAELNMM